MHFDRRATASLCLLLGLAGLGRAQNSADAEVAPAEDKRAFGVLPNHRTTEASLPFQRISAKEKLHIAMLDSFDWPVYPTAAVFAGFYQLADQNHEFGQGMKGYAKRLASSYADQLAGNMMTEGFVPALTRQDPRYFRLGAGSRSGGGRFWYSLTRTVITRNDSGRPAFNFSEWGGAAASTALSNLYYTDTRTAKDNATKLLIQVGSDTIGNLLKEFWPDVKKKLRKKG